MSEQLSMELFHVINRGIDGRTIFNDSADRARFVHDLYEFNDVAPAPEYHHAIARSRNVGRQTSYIRERLVDIHGWKLMENHYHLLLSERVENGIDLFLRKLSGYARYFNERHKRRGVLLQGSKRVLIGREAHFLYILHYVHLNALDTLRGFEHWRQRDKGNMPSVAAALAHLNKDRWSSYLDYTGTPNFPSLLTKTLFETRHGGYADSLFDFLQDRTFEKLESKLLEYT